MSTLVKNRSQHPASKEGFAHSLEIELLFGQPPRDPWRGIESEGVFVASDAPDRITFTARSVETDAAWVIEKKLLGLPEDHLRTSMKQSWSWPDARKLAGRVESRVILRDLRATGLDYHLRIRLMNELVAAAVRCSSPVAVHWVTTEQLVDPAAFLGSLEHEGPESLFGAVNVRLFRIDRDESDHPLPTPEIIMDTLGLTAVGLDDFQIHTREYDPHDVGNYLYAVSQYAFEKGAVISPGDEIMGIDGDRWKCEIEDSLVDPERAVIDIDTAEPGLAGRKR